ncbi:hypothetical protein C6497_08585 [Candidatus Poribacteria bacterium]|nr:MAG: hypothetical protein C6497_08585 [Candidatus Poribacteria bacterium]
MKDSDKVIPANSNNSIENNIKIVYIRSFPAMILSAVFPGLGQMYLGQYFKAVIILIGFLSALGFIYLNSYPVNEWKDLLEFDTISQNSKILHTKSKGHPHAEGSIKIWTLDSGKIIMYRPSWKLKVTSGIQGLIFWIYAVSTAWRGKPNII